MTLTGAFRGVVALDGPAGTGKSTVARELARRLGARYLDTGAMYRAATWAVLRAGVDPADAGGVTDVVRRSRIRIGDSPEDPAVVTVDGIDVGPQIRDAEVTGAVSAVSAVPTVRTILIAQQRAVIGAGGIVVEGRDIGAVVAPDADVKAYLTATADVRAGRRGREQGSSGRDAAAAIDRRDSRDSQINPFRPAPGAVEIDTTELSVADVVERLVALSVQGASS